VRRRVVKTPFGPPSDEYVSGVLGGREVVFLPRHGRGHRLLPSEINHRANVFGFKRLGVDRIISVSAVGSLQAKLRPRDIVLPDQYYDRTKQALAHTFFGNGIVAHVAFGEPTCAELGGQVAAVWRKVLKRTGAPKVRLHVGGTYVNMEGPAFSTKAESNSYRAMGFDVVGMTSLGEAKLCREAEICYQAVAMVTDYDCWHASKDPVTVEMIVGHLMANTALAREFLKALIAALPDGRRCRCGETLRDAMLTQANVIPAGIKRALKPLIGKYVA